jgi:hypothetical protein
LIDRVLTNQALEDEILARQDAALDHLLARDFPSLVTRFVGEVLASLPLPPPSVSPGFWTEFKLAEELEIVRDTRPAAFRALPLPPDAGHVADLGHRR